MRWFRSCLTAFCFTLFGVCGFIIGTVLFPLFILFLPKRKQRLFLSRVIRYSWIIFIKIMIVLRLIDVKIVGREKLKNLKGHIVIANHPTLLDVVLLGSIVPDSICVVKSALLKNFFIKRIIQSVYLVNGDNPSDFLRRGQDILSEGANLIIFPEGTRTDNNDCKKIHRGFAQLALRSKAPILLVKIKCTPLILGKKQKWYDVGGKTVLYHIHALRQISVSLDAKENLYHQAKKLSENIYCELFERID